MMNVKKIYSTYEAGSFVWDFCFFVFCVFHKNDFIHSVPEDYGLFL